MAREKDPNRTRAFEIYKEHGGNISNREIANILGVNEKTIGSWKSKAKDNWVGVLQNKNGKKAEYSNKEPTNKAAKKTGTNNKVKNTKNRKPPSGNPNPSYKFPEHNKFAVKHGIFSKYLHPEQIEIMDAMDDLSILDQLWMQIKIQFSAIIRAQDVMQVENSTDHVSELEESKEFGNRYKVALAHERYDSLIKAQTRAMSEYRSLVKKYLELAGEDDERALKLQIMQQDLNIKTAQATAIQKETEGSEVTIEIIDPWRAQHGKDDI